MEKYYFDTSIWLDIAEKRGYNGKMAKRLFEKIIKGNHVIIYSDIIITELKKLRYSQHEIGIILKIAKPDNLRKAHTSRDQLLEAKRVAKRKGVPLGDAMHAVLSRENGAQLVSRDHDFKKLKNIAESKLPEELI